MSNVAYWHARAVLAQGQVREAAALTIAYFGSNGGTRLDDAIPQATWDGLTERGLVRHGRELTGEGFVALTDEGVEYLLSLVRSPGAAA